MSKNVSKKATKNVVSIKKAIKARKDKIVKQENKLKVLKKKLKKAA